MGVGEHIHWFLTSRCDMHCSYCFKPDHVAPERTPALEQIARILVENRVKHVTIGGGEPTLVKGLDNVLRILKDGGAYVSLHTNGMRLTKERIRQLSETVSDIALPIDSLDSAIQEALRGSKFMGMFRRLFDVADRLRQSNIDVCYHTVFTALNQTGMLKLYNKLKKTDFKYWQVYEFNDVLAFARILANASSVADQRIMNSIKQKHDAVDFLRGLGTPEKGYTNCLFAKFLLVEEQLLKKNDARIKFVGLRDPDREMYVFLNNAGDIFFYHWYSGKKRYCAGNIVRESFPKVVQNLKTIQEKGPLLNEKTNADFVDALNDLPIWAKLWEGNYFSEELDDIHKRYMPAVERLCALYEERVEKLENSLRD